MDHIGLPVIAALQGFGTLAVSGGIPADQIKQRLYDTIMFIVRGCRP